MGLGIGIYLIFEGIISMLKVKDKRFVCQLGRIIRIGIGIWVILKNTTMQ